MIKVTSLKVEQDFYPRYSNQWSQTEWGSKVIRWCKLCYLEVKSTFHIRIEAGGQIIEMDLDSIAIKNIQNL